MIFVFVCMFETILLMLIALQMGQELYPRHFFCLFQTRLNNRPRLSESSGNNQDGEKARFCHLQFHYVLSQEHRQSVSLKEIYFQRKPGTTKGFLCSLSSEPSPLEPGIFTHHLVRIPLFSRNQMPPKYVSEETQPEGKTNSLAFF